MIELVLINTLLNNNKLIDEISFLEPKHFKENKQVFEKMVELYNEKNSVSQIDLLLEGFEINTKDEFLETDIKLKAKVIFDNYNLDLIKRSIARIDYNNLDDTLIKLNQIIDKIETNYNSSLITRPINIDSFIDKMSEIRHCETEFGIMVKSLPTFNKITGGMLQTDLIGIYGKEKSTKTTLTHQIVLDVALDQKIPVVIFNFEMDVLQILMKTFSMRTGISTNVLRNPKQNIISDNEFNIKSGKLKKDFQDSRLFIIDEMLNEQQIYNKTKELIKSYGVKLVVIDYLMLIEPLKKSRERREELNSMSRFFKRMAKQLNVIIILVSQANDSGMREAEAKGLSRDSNYYFYVEQLEQGQEVRISGETYKAVEGDYVVINRGIRHDLGNKAFITRFIENKYCEIEIKSKYFENNI